MPIKVRTCNLWNQKHIKMYVYVCAYFMKVRTCIPLEPKTHQNACICMCVFYKSTHVHTFGTKGELLQMSKYKMSYTHTYVHYIPTYTQEHTENDDTSPNAQPQVKIHTDIHAHTDIHMNVYKSTHLHMSGNRHTSPNIEPEVTMEFFFSSIQ